MPDMLLHTTPAIDPAPPVEGRQVRPEAGLTVREFAARYRVSADKVRTWIRRGEVKAINTAGVLCGKPRFVIPPEALAAFERGRNAAPPPKPPRRRKRRQLIDYYPGD
jgi:hypothetical protein